MKAQPNGLCKHRNIEHLRRCCRRRPAVVAFLASVISVSAPAASAIERQDTIQDQIDQCPSGGKLAISGLYEEQIVVSKPVTLYAKPGERASLQWQTTKPYQSTITVSPGGSLRLENIAVRHSSPSVANNYAVFIQGGDANITGCDICSSTGSGIGLEGGAITVNGSKIHDCAGNGAVIAGSIDSGGLSSSADEDLRPKASFMDCEVSANGGSGIIALDDAVLELEVCTICRNSKSGLDLRDCEARLDGCTVTQNRQASILQKRVANLQIFEGRGRNVVQPNPSFSR